MAAQMETFARRLHKLLAEKEMSQSDLARKVWGTKTDPRGYQVARNRDLVSSYLSGKSVPDGKNLRKIAKALGITDTELAPDLTATAMDQENPEIAMTAIAGHHDRVYLRVNKLVPLGIASQVIQLLSGVK